MNNKYLKLGRAIFGFIVLLFFVFIFYHYAEVKQIPSLLVKIRWYYIVILLLLEYLFIINRGLIYKILFVKLGGKITLEESTKLFLSSGLVNILAPVGGATGMMVYVKNGHRFSLSRSRTLAMTLIFYFINYLALAVLLLFIFSYLLIIGHVKLYYIVTYAVLIIFIVFVSLFTSAILNHNELGTKIAKVIIGFVNRVLNYLKIIESKNLFDKISSEIKEVYGILKQNSDIFWQPLMFFVVGFLLETAIIYLIFFALGQNVNLLTVLSGYAIGILFMFISITPVGVGVTEPIMSLFFISMGIPIEISVLTVLIFRVITFWLPMPIGMLYIKRYVL